MPIPSHKSRCLILSCSHSKSDEPDLLPALQRYMGPMYQVLHRYRRENPTDTALKTYILSAQYGLIDSHKPIPVYDQKMTKERAEELRPSVLDKAQREIATVGYEEIFLAMGKVYLLALDGLSDICHQNTKISVSSVASGKKLSELRNWLWGTTPTNITRPAHYEVSANKTQVTAVLRGHEISMTTAEAEACLREALSTSPDKAKRIRNWHINIDGERVSPKWAAESLFGVPVSAFSADEARRVLQRLGITCYQT